MAVSPTRNADRFLPKSQVSTPGGIHLFSASQSWNTLTPAGPLTVAFMRRRVEELAALVAEALLEHELGVGRLAEEGGAVGLAAGRPR